MKKLFYVIEDICVWFDLTFYTNPKFIYQTKIRPKYVPHHCCKFYDWSAKKHQYGWYILDKKGEMIPWVHYHDEMMCLYPNMVEHLN